MHNKKLMKLMLKQQRAEITEHIIYSKLSKKNKNKKNARILSEISDDEIKHYNIWKNITKKDLKPNKSKIHFYMFISSFLGLVFSLKLMRKKDKLSRRNYELLSMEYLEVEKIREDKVSHESKLIEMLKDDRLSYASSIVLGLNDALVELTGTLAGLTLAIQNNVIIAVTGLIMGIAASLSMAASEFLSAREEGDNEIMSGKTPLKSATYTGIAYIITVIILISPYFLINSVFIALLTMLLLTLIIILMYTYYISVAKELNFRRRFLEMAFISLGVAAISFAIGWVVKFYFGIEV